MQQREVDPEVEEYVLGKRCGPDLGQNYAEDHSSTDEQSRHNTNTYKPGPGLPLSVVMKVKPVFEELSTDKLLRKCLHCLTQNQNKCFNATIWERLPKTRFDSRTQLEFGVCDVVANFNIGRKASVLIFEKLNMTPGKYTLKGCQNINHRRLFRSAYKNKESSKKRRKIIWGKSKRKDDKNEEKEGETYAAGAY